GQTVIPVAGDVQKRSIRTERGAGRERELRASGAAESARNRWLVSRRIGSVEGRAGCVIRDIASIGGQDRCDWDAGWRTDRDHASGREAEQLDVVIRAADCPHRVPAGAGHLTTTEQS